MQDKQNLIYLYDLPKDSFTSARLAEILKGHGIQLEHKPQVRRDPIKPFYSAIMCITDQQQFAKAREVLRNFEIEGKWCRGLPFDNSLLGSNLTKTNESSNIFVRKIPKEMKPMELEEMFSSFDPEKRRPVKSLKISRDADHSSRGYGFVCYENEEDAAKAATMLEESATRKECLAVRWNPRDRADARKLYNNLYVKNYPEEYNDQELTALFQPFGHVGSLIQFDKPGLGKFAFICFVAEDKNDHQYGPEAASRAIEALNGKDMGNGKTLYVKPALSASNRKAELLRETIKYKNSKKRCNLYVKNFDPKTNEDTLMQLFSSNGQREIESIKLFPVDKEEKAYAFICFKTPDQAQSALQELNNMKVGVRNLQICNYELKEFREIADEESKDKMGFQRFKEMNYQQRQWNDITSKDEFQYKLIELLKNLPQNQRAGLYGGQMGQQRQGQMGGQRYNNNGPRQNSAGRPQNRNMGYNNQNRGNSGMNMGGAMPAPEGQIRPQGGMGGQQPQGPEQLFYANTLKLVPSVVPANPHMKQQVGNAIFDFVQKIKGPQFAPKITGMLIDLPHEDIKGYLQNYGEFHKKVEAAGNLLQQQAGQAPPQMAPPMMGAPPMQAPGQTPMPPSNN